MSITLLLAIALPFVVLTAALYALWAWADKHDPMQRSKFEFLTPGQRREDPHDYQ